MGVSLRHQNDSHLFFMKKFTHADITLDKIVKENGFLFVDFTYNFYGRLRSYRATVKEKFDLRLKSEKEMLCLTLRFDHIPS